MSVSFSATAQMEKDQTIVFVEGDFTGKSETALFQAIDQIDPNQKLIVLDLQKSEYINSSGIALLISLINRLNERNASLMLRSMNDHFKKVLRTVGLSEFIGLS